MRDYNIRIDDGFRLAQGTKPYKKQSFWDRMVLEVMNDQCEQLDVWARLMIQITEIEKLSMQCRYFEKKRNEECLQYVHSKRFRAIKGLQYWAKHKALPYINERFNTACWNSPALVSWLNRQGVGLLEPTKAMRKKPDDLMWLLWLHLQENMGNRDLQGSYLHPTDRSAQLARMTNSETNEEELLTLMAVNMIVDSRPWSDHRNNAAP